MLVRLSWVSWLEDFSDGEAFWNRLMTAPTFSAFLEQVDRLPKYERDKIMLYHAIRESQAAGSWPEWADPSND